MAESSTLTGLPHSLYASGRSASEQLEPFITADCQLSAQCVDDQRQTEVEMEDLM